MIHALRLSVDSLVASQQSWPVGSLMNLVGWLPCPWPSHIPKRVWCIGGPLFFVIVRLFVHPLYLIPLERFIYYIFSFKLPKTSPYHSPFWGWFASGKSRTLADCEVVRFFLSLVGELLFD